MKISELWLREWVDIPYDSAELAKQLTMIGLEVESIAPVAGSFQQVVVGHVKTTKPHPQANKLTLCEVNIGEKDLAIVCGASNVRSDLKVAVALVGAKLPDLEIKETHIRGQLSQGMLCSASELGLEAKSEGILELDNSAPIGMDLRKYLALDDQVLNIELTPNRADCLSVIGIAREISAIEKRPFCPPVVEPVSATTNNTREVSLLAKEACPNYCGRIIHHINPHAKTPIWMKERLRRSGIRSIHPVVDVTNYVMLEMGQPMHAFDLNKIGAHIQVRFAFEEEKLTLLDGQTVTLTDTMLVIANEKEALALAGVMGGQESAVTEETSDIFLESAYFEPKIIAGVARHFGISSDSAQRFERGIDVNLQHKALERATYLIQDIMGGEPGPICCQTDVSWAPEPNVIEFNPKRIESLTGVKITEAEIFELLTYLGMSIEKKDQNWFVSVPTYRVDIALDVDLVEEVIRLYGYHKIPAQSLQLDLKKGSKPIHAIGDHIASFLVSRGFHEVINYSFVDPQFQQILLPSTEVLTLINPISSELGEMRLSLLPGLLASMMYNLNRSLNTVKLFETGVTFAKHKGRVIETPKIAGLLIGEHGALNCHETTRSFDFYDLKGDLEALFCFLNLKNVQFLAHAESFLHPGKSTEIICEDNPIGFMGVLHPSLADELDVKHEVILFELDLLALTKGNRPRYHPISKYPQIRRDLSFLIDKNVYVDAVIAEIYKIEEAKLIKAVNVFDVYTGTNIPDNKKSVAIAITLQDDNKTLIDVEINHLVAAIIKKLDKAFHIILRD